MIDRDGRSRDDKGHKLAFIATETKSRFSIINRHVANENAVDHYCKLGSAAKIYLVDTHLELSSAAVYLILSKAGRNHAVKCGAGKPRKQITCIW